VLFADFIKQAWAVRLSWLENAYSRFTPAFPGMILTGTVK